jgi:hypothetical protein
LTGKTVIDQEIPIVRSRIVTDAHDEPTLDDVMDTLEDAKPNRREHAKASPRLDEDELDRRTDIEREEVGLEGDQEEA